MSFCACGCGKQVRASEYHSDCANECKCGCGGRARYAYKPGHRPETVCQRCGKVFVALGGDAQHCNNCRRAIKAGGPVERDVSLSYGRKMQKAAPEGRRWCSGCEQYRLLKFFGRDSQRHYSRCKPCHRAQIRAAKWKKTFGITPDAPETGYVPLEILVWLFENGYPERSVFHYLCPKEHQRAWYIPSLGERASVLIYKDFKYPA